MTVDWNTVAKNAAATLERRDQLDVGQRDSLAWIVGRLRECQGIILADEVGTGKTRIACAVIHAVVAAGGRVATVVPKGLMHQWIAESRELDSTIEVRSLTTLPELFRSVASPERWKQLAPQPEKPEWWLVSHNFRVPQVRSNSDTWRAALPALVELELASKAAKQDRRKREGRFAHWLSLTEKHSIKRWAYWDGMEQIAKDVAKRVRPLVGLRRAMASLPELRIVSKKGQQLTELDVDAFRDAGGERVAEQILGIWLGDFDLIVVDEAHKSRGIVEDDDDLSMAKTAKVLTRLLDVVLKPSPTVRRLCLTATPMELDLHQWLDLLRRAGCDLGDEGQQVVKRLRNATRSAAAAPDEVARLDELCAAAAGFTRTLAPYVTRRRHADDALIQEFTASDDTASGPHPHRRVEAVPIGWSEASAGATAWLDVLFAAECMSHAARGLSKAHTTGWPVAIRDAYTKLCKGHVSADFEHGEASVVIPSAEEADDHTRGKIGRVNYWYGQLRDARERVAENGDSADGLIESEHPRITAAVREIELWTDPRTTTSASALGEKVLVFGVFLGPLHVLRDVLNVRNALRAIDDGRPIAHSMDRNAELMPIAFRQLARLRQDGVIRGRLKDASTNEVRRALRDGHGEYVALQRRLRRSMTSTVASWFRDPERLGEVDDAAIEGNVRAHTMAFVIDELLNQSRSTDDELEVRAMPLAEVYFRQHIKPELTDLDGDADEDDLRMNALRALFDDDQDTRQRRFAVLLSGDTHSTTRRYIQAAFNRPTSSPRVLIAQSQVGREGLNLHEACRVVIQFHAEWNPAILEQQIGRVDRKGSLWEKLARNWIDGVAKLKPRIEVRQLVFEGTYDAFQWERVARRQRLFDASLFGSLLPDEAWDRVPSDRVGLLEAAAPSFRPPRHE